MIDNEILNIAKDIIVPVFVLITSIVAVVFTIIALRVQRNHNYKSLQPIGKIRTFNYPDNISLRIDNYGTGPLIIKSLFVNGKDIGPEDGLLNCIPKEFADSLPWENYSASYPGRAIPPNEHLELLAWSRSNYKKKESKKAKLDKMKLREILKSYTIRIEYYGIYKNEIYHDEKELTWYGEHT